MGIRLLLKCLSVLVMATVVTAVGSSATSAREVATAARHLSVNESVRTHLLSHHRTKLSEQGSGSGTFNCAITLNLNLASNSATIAFTAYPHNGGSFSGNGSVSVHYIGTIADFKGTLAISRGTGGYSRASARSLHITGTIKTNSYEIQAQVTGPMTD